MDTIIAQTGLTDVRGRVIGHLSRGYRQRVGLAQALLHNPPVLILDEPTTGLDPNQIIEIRDLIRNLAGSHTIILSTHMLAEATAICQRVIIIHRGRIVAVDTPEQLGAKLRTSETLSLTVKQSDPHLLEALHHLPGVIRVSQGATPQTYELETQMGQDIREELTKLVVSRNVGLLELKTQPLTLEEAFKVLTQTDTPGGFSNSTPDGNHQRVNQDFSIMTPVQTIMAKELRSVLCFAGGLCHCGYLFGYRRTCCLLGRWPTQVTRRFA